MQVYIAGLQSSCHPTISARMKDLDAALCFMTSRNFRAENCRQDIEIEVERFEFERDKALKVSKLQPDDC